jgi:hypothetical protein
MDPIKVRERLQAAWIELREAETGVHEMAHAVNGGAAEDWTREQREAAYGLIVQERGRLDQTIGNARARDAMGDAVLRLRDLAGVG